MSRLFDGQFFRRCDAAGRPVWERVKAKVVDAGDAAHRARAATEHRLLTVLLHEAPGHFVEPLALLTAAGEVAAEDGLEQFAHHAVLVLELGRLNLAEYLKLNRNLSFPAKLALAHRLLEIVGAAHSCGIVLMDFKLANVVQFFKEHDVVWKGVDLDGGRLLGTDLLHDDSVATPEYAAPELFSGRQTRASFALDIWSLAMTIFELFDGNSLCSVHNLLSVDAIRVFMSSPDLQEAIQRLINANFKGEGNKLVREFLTATLVVDPSLRPGSIRTLLNNKLFTDCSASISTSHIIRKLEDLEHATEKGFGMLMDK